MTSMMSQEKKSSRPDQWADFLTETYALYGSQAEIVIEAHNWPHWGKDVIRSYLSNLRRLISMYSIRPFI